MKKSTVYWIVGGIAAVGLSLGIYTLYRRSKDNNQDFDIDEDTETKQQEIVESQKPNSQVLSGAAQAGAASAAQQLANLASAGAAAVTTYPFSNVTTGNAFRKWVNKYHPEFVFQGQRLDPTGSYDNKYMRAAWSMYAKEYLNRVKLGKV